MIGRATRAVLVPVAATSMTAASMPAPPAQRVRADSSSTTSPFAESVLPNRTVREESSTSYSYDLGWAAGKEGHGRTTFAIIANDPSVFTSPPPRLLSAADRNFAQEPMWVPIDYGTSRIGRITSLDMPMAPNMAAPFGLQYRSERRDSSLRPEVASKVDRAFATADAESFEDGMHSKLATVIDRQLIVDPVTALEKIREHTFSPSTEPAVAREALIALGSNDDAGSRPARRMTLEMGLSHFSPFVRDGAVIGLGSLDDPESIPALEAAIRREPVAELRDDLTQLLAALRPS